MNQVEYLVNEIKKLPPKLLMEVADYIGYIKKKHMVDEKEINVKDITLASEKSLAKDWNKSEEDEAWQDL